MKNLFIFLIFSFVLVLIFGNKTFAAIGDMPFGGRISLYPIPEITCPTGYGAFNISPVGVSAPGPFLIPFYNSPLGGATLSVGQWILGLYRPIPTPGGCVTTSPPPVPVPTFEVKREFNTSEMGL
ncbi:MAG: hypothetical protein KBF62_01385 [Candidatus Pacebacteria bacterium]|jgi:hypothetical protein|nr:hypothetical protein [Candidatus Paceibacterota bacterium]MBP9058273.1 hypothetical protein [Candidatus Paceibacterota bacterium]MBP9770512.1 hypothetical protein [Candidatus Paceibacterota bacterium]